jgi:hypothetical protein
MTSPLHGEGRVFESHRAHRLFFDSEAVIVSDDKEEKLPTDEKLPTSDDEESENILSYVNRKLRASSAERLTLSKESYRKARKWDLEGRDLERRRVEALEALAEREREGSQTDLDEQLPYSKKDLNTSSRTARLCCAPNREIGFSGLRR